MSGAPRDVKVEETVGEPSFLPMRLKGNTEHKLSLNSRYTEEAERNRRVNGVYTDRILGNNKEMRLQRHLKGVVV